MKFGMFFLGEYVHVITVSFLTVILFFGGWDFPFLNQDQTGFSSALAKFVVILVKVDAGDPVHHVGALDPAPVSLRPAHGPGLEVVDSAGARQPGGHRRDRADDLRAGAHRDSFVRSTRTGSQIACEPTTPS